MANSVTTPLQGGFTHFANNATGQLTAAQLTSTYSTSTLKTPTKNFAFPYKGSHINFIQGVPVLCDAALLAALTAAGAAVV